ncbi:apoptosis-inducing factor 3-like isoform X3 [Mauremys reevesii]|uniref:apoptosis-inducing factor 3-like isoform X3 n=1 Tax=Mauremys reevesii TaxID=260615 RepID=UPI00193F91DB|nr:apoptosis-inducing factor 3-like isoform X3 [Mauremys reevesii]
MDTEDSVTEQVCQESDIQDGELREVEVAGHKVLLVRNKMEFSAVGSKCTHAGASLSKGVLVGNRLRCPWHGACFNIRTGDIEEYPTLDCLPCFKVRVEDGKVLITAKKKDLESDRKLKAMSERCRSNENTMLLLGGGAAALVCAETLRQEGFTGRIIMVTKEKHVPYDRTQLSKAMDKTLESIYLRQQDFFEAHGIDVWTDKEVVSVDTQGQKAHFQDGAFQRYDQLLIATGSSPRQLQCPGSDLENVCSLQTPEDANRILHLATGKRVVILGASFIGMEVAAFLSDKASAICVVGREEFPFQAVLGPQVGGVAMKMLQNKRVKFYMKAEISELRGENRKVTKSLIAGLLPKSASNLDLYRSTPIPCSFHRPCNLQSPRPPNSTLVSHTQALASSPLPLGSESPGPRNMDWVVQGLGKQSTIARAGWGCFWGGEVLRQHLSEWCCLFPRLQRLFWPVERSYLQMLWWWE